MCRAPAARASMTSRGSKMVSHRRPIMSAMEDSRFIISSPPADLSWRGGGGHRAGCDRMACGEVLWRKHVHGSVPASRSPVHCTLRLARSICGGGRAGWIWSREARGCGPFAQELEGTGRRVGRSGNAPGGETGDASMESRDETRPGRSGRTKRNRAERGRPEQGRGDCPGIPIRDTAKAPVEPDAVCPQPGGHLGEGSGR